MSVRTVLFAAGLEGTVHCFPFFGREHAIFVEVKLRGYGGGLLTQSFPRFVAEYFAFGAV